MIILDEPEPNERSPLNIKSPESYPNTILSPVQRSNDENLGPAPPPYDLASSSSSVPQQAPSSSGRSYHTIAIPIPLPEPYTRRSLKRLLKAWLIAVLVLALMSSLFQSLGEVINKYERHHPPSKPPSWSKPPPYKSRNPKGPRGGNDPGGRLPSLPHDPWIFFPDAPRHEDGMERRPWPVRGPLAPVFATVSSPLPPPLQEDSWLGES